MSEQKQERPPLPTPDQWGAWKIHPCSEFFFYALNKAFHDVTEDVVMGETLNTGSVDETALATTRALTEAKVLYMIGKMSYEDACDMLDISLESEVEDAGEYNP